MTKPRIGVKDIAAAHDLLERMPHASLDELIIVLTLAKVESLAGSRVKTAGALGIAIRTLTNYLWKAEHYYGLESVRYKPSSDPRYVLVKSGRMSWFVPKPICEGFLRPWNRGGAMTRAERASREWLRFLEKTNKTCRKHHVIYRSDRSCFMCKPN